MKPSNDHKLVRMFLDDGGWQWVFVRQVGTKWVRFVRLAHGATTEKMMLNPFDIRIDHDSWRPAKLNDLTRWQRVTRAWRVD